MNIVNHVSELLEIAITTIDKHLNDFNQDELIRLSKYIYILESKILKHKQNYDLS